MTYFVGDISITIPIDVHFVTFEVHRARAIGECIDGGGSDSRRVSRWNK